MAKKCSCWPDVAISLLYCQTRQRGATTVSEKAILVKFMGFSISDEHRAESLFGKCFETAFRPRLENLAEPLIEKFVPNEVSEKAKKKAEPKRIRPYSYRKDAHGIITG